MTDGGAVTLHARTRYLDVLRPRRLAYTQQFCEPGGRVSRHPLAPVWPETMRTTVTFAEEGPSRTRVTVRSEAEGPAAQEEMSAFIEGRSGMTQGWTGSFDKLDACLGQAPGVSAAPRPTEPRPAADR
jgi:uncharacterized protein YndB with AHSA1/START domain